MSAQVPISVSTYSGSAAPGVAPGASAPESGSLVSAVVPVAAAPAVAAPAAPTAPVEAPAPLSLTAEATTEEDKQAATQAEADAGKPGVEYTYDKTGNAALDMALSFLGTNGYGPDHPAMKEAAKGNFSMLKAELSSKGIKGAAEHLALGEEAYKDHSSKREAKEKADRDGIIRVVGGEQQWSSIQKWASTNADAAEKSEIGQALRQGGIVARATAAYLAQQYERAAGTIIKPGRAVSENAGGLVPSNAPLTSQQYRQELGALRAKFGSTGLDQRPEYQALAQRFQANQSGKRR